MRSRLGKLKTASADDWASRALAGAEDDAAPTVPATPGPPGKSASPEEWAAWQAASDAEPGPGYGPDQRMRVRLGKLKKASAEDWAARELAEVPEPAPKGDASITVAQAGPATAEAPVASSSSSAGATPDDVHAMMYPDDPAAAARARAAAGQLRRGGDRGAFLSALGSPLLSAVGQQMTGEAAAGQKLLATVPDHLAKRELQKEQTNKLRQANEAMNDPATAEALRATLAEVFPDTDFSKASAGTLQHILDKTFNAKTTAASKEEIAKSNRLLKASHDQDRADRQKAADEAKVDARKAADDRKNEQEKTKLIGDLEKSFDPSVASSRSTFGQAGNQIFRGAKAVAILKQPGGQLTNQDMIDFTSSLASMMTGGVPTQRLIDEITPQDLKGKTNSIVQWLTSSPQTADRQEWIKRFQGIIEREEHIAQHQIRETQLQHTGKLKRLLALDPDAAAELVSRAKLDQPHPAGYLDPAQGFKLVKPPAATAAAATAPVKISSNAEYDALPSGAEYIAPDGQHRKKK